MLGNILNIRSGWRSPLLPLLLFLLTVAAYASPGDLDLSFNSTGFVTTAVTASADEANAVAVQTDGKIVVAGYSANRTGFALVRYTSSGALDTTFGTGGIVTVSFAAAEVRSIAILADGKIVVGGYASSINFSNRSFVVARFTESGALDTTFGGGDGITTTSIGLRSEVFGITVQPDGKIIAAGSTASGGPDDFAVSRYNSDGSLDTSFNSPTGYLTTNFGSSEEGTAVKLQNDGKIVVSGNSGAGNRVNVARYNTDGSLDTTFDSDGKVSTVLLTNPRSMAIQSDGKIVVGGSDNDYCLVRYNSNGSLDSTFDTDGIVCTTVSNPSLLQGIAIDLSGKILATGFTIFGKNDQDIFLSRHLADGSLDPAFDGGDGIVTTSLGTNGDRSFAIAVQSDGRIVLAGSLLDTNRDFAVARYQGAAPTAAPATLGGRLTDQSGNGIPHVGVVLSGGSLSQPLTAITNSFGYFNFYDLQTGQTYIVTPDSGRYTFTPNSLVINFTEEFLAANFVGVE